MTAEKLRSVTTTVLHVLDLFFMRNDIQDHASALRWIAARLREYADVCDKCEKSAAAQEAEKTVPAPNVWQWRCVKCRHFNVLTNNTGCDKCGYVRV